MRIAVISIVAVLVACAGATSPAPPASVSGSTVSPAPSTSTAAPAAAPADVPKLRLPRTFVPSGYVASLAVDPAADVFDGSITISGDVAQRTSVLWLHGKDLQIKRATAAQQQIAVTPRGDDLLELRGDFAPGPIELRFDYTGRLDPLNTAGAFKQTAAGRPYVFTQLEALYARRVFPCLDEPDSKVPWQLTIDVPKHMIAVSNTPVVRESEVGGRRRFEFAKTKPLPSYLVAFGVGELDIVDGGTSKSGVPIRVITTKGRAADATYAAKTTGPLLDLLEDYFGIPYPYEKLDTLTIPVTVGFGAMENAGLITYTEKGALFDEKTASWKQRRSFLGTQAHEIAHQWFGDLVTMTWWDDLWLNEGFATWIGNKIVARFDPALRGELGELDLRMGALAADALVHARKVRQPIEQVDDIKNAFDSITYVKGAAVLNMFEAYVGPAVFQRGVREYLKARSYGNATSEHFVAALSTAAGKDLAPAFATYLDQQGAPELEATLACDKAGAKLSLRQRRYVRPGSPPPPAQTPWIMPVCVAHDRDGKRAETCTLLTGETDTLALAGGKRCPRWVMPTAQGRGYYRVRYTSPDVAKLRDEAWTQLSWTERRALFFDVVDGALYGDRATTSAAPTPAARRLSLPLVLSLVPKLFAGGDRFTVGDALSVPLAIDRFVADDQRPAYEAWLRATFGASAAKLGVLPRAGDNIDVEDNRVDLLRVVAWHGRDPKLVARCVELAKNWRELPAAVRGVVLRIAADASPDLHAKILADVRNEPDRIRRDEMYAALAATRDPKRVQSALELLLDPKLDIRETQALLTRTSTEATRRVAEQFVRTHKDKLLERLPDEAVTGSIRLVASLFAGSCDEATRDESRQYVIAAFGTLGGGQRVIDQQFEALDQCIASRKLLEPELREFLAGVKTGTAGKR